MVTVGVPSCWTKRLINFLKGLGVPCSTQRLSDGADPPCTCERSGWNIILEDWCGMQCHRLLIIYKTLYFMPTLTPVPALQWFSGCPVFMTAMHGNMPPQALKQGRKCLLLRGTSNFFYKKKKKINEEEEKKTSEQTFNSQRKSLNRLKLGCLQRVFKSILQTLLFQSLCSFIYEKLNTG